MPITCVAIDDEPLALQLLQQYVAKLPTLQLVKCFEDALAAIGFLKQFPVDLVFVDINMPDINGLDLVHSLPQKPMIIFTTAYKHFAQEGFELDAIDYLLKPISLERFSKAVHKASEYFNYKNQAADNEAQYLFVYSEYRMVKINLGDILYIESLEDYIRIHLHQQKPLLTLMTLKGVLEKLPTKRFRRIHRSYVVAVPHVTSVQGRKVQLVSGIELPVSDTYADFIGEWKNLF